VGVPFVFAIQYNSDPRWGTRVILARIGKCVNDCRGKERGRSAEKKRKLSPILVESYSVFANLMADESEQNEKIRQFFAHKIEKECSKKILFKLICYFFLTLF
jgi:hypothetical protein